MVDVPLGADAAGTAQSFRAVLNADPGTSGVRASGDGHVITVSAVTAGSAGTSITLAKSATHPTLSAATLQATSRIKSLIGGRVSNLRGVLTLFFDGLIAANNPYPKPWKVRVKRTHAGWQGGSPWYANRAAIMLASGTIRAMNPAHIIYQALTDPAWGRAFPASSLYLPSFVSAANTLYDEGFGLCMKWSRQMDIGEFIQSVISHIGASLYVDRANGLLTLRLIRGGYDENALPVFDYESGLLEILEDDATAGDASFNEMIVKWRDPNRAGEERQTRYQNLAAIQSSGAVSSETIDYPGIPTADLAARVAQRELASKAGGIRRMKLVFDRRGRKIAPGGVFRLRVPSRGISNIVLRAGVVEEGRQTDPRITVTAVADVFALPSTTYVAEPIETWVPPDVSASIATSRRWREVSYRDLVRTLLPADLAAVPVDAGFVAVAAKRPSAQATDYVLATAGDGEEYVTRGVNPWTPNGVLAFDIATYTTSIQLVAGHEGLGLLGSAGFSAWIESEIVQVQDYDPATGAMTIARGCLDSVPIGHAAGVRVWFPDLHAGTDGREYAPGETVRIKILTRSNGRQLSLADAPEDDIVISGRQGRPYPPGNVRVNGGRYADDIAVVGDAVLTWAHRDRVLQADLLTPHGDSSIGPEAGTTYSIRVYDGTALLRTTTGVSGTTWTYTEAMHTADNAEFESTFGTDAHAHAGPAWVATLELESVRGGLVSLQRYRWLQSLDQV